MKHQPLTSSRTVLSDGRICHAYRWKNFPTPIRVVDDAENALLVQELFADQSLLPAEKANILICMLFANPAGVVEAVDDIGQLLADMVWQVAGLDIDGTHKDTWAADAPCFDWRQDAGRIRATLLSAYGVKWDDIKRQMTYSELCELLENAPQESPFSQAVHYRTAKEPEATKYNAEEIRRFRKAREFYALNKADTNTSGRQNTASNDLFQAMKKKAANG